jgi:hypothetical protein
MPLYLLLVIIGLIAFTLWAINKYITGTWRTILIVSVLVGTVIWLFNLFGLFDGLGNKTVGHTHHIITFAVTKIKSLWA